MLFFPPNEGKLIDEIIGEADNRLFWPDYYDHEIKEFDKYLMFLSKVRLRYGFLTDKILFIVYFFSQKQCAKV